MGISSIGNDPWEQLIASIVRIESEPKFRLEDRKEQQESQKKVLQDFDGKISSLHKLLGGFTDPLSNPFRARTANVPEGSPFEATASDRAVTGNYSLRVDRLASTDTRVSNQVGSAETAQGLAGSFTFSVAAPTDADPDARVSLAVNVAAGDSLADISASINGAAQQAVQDGLITNDQQPNASIIQESTESARLVLRSGDSGYTNRLQFEADPDGILSTLGISNDAIAAGGGGGMITEVGTSATNSQLNSKFELNGLTLYRDSNQVDDAIDNVTLNLTRAGDPAETFTIGTDTESILEDMKGFVEEYNALVDFMRDRSKVDGDSGERGPLAGDRSVSSLRFGLRNQLIQTVADQPEGAPARLADVGLELDREGKLSIADEDALTAAAENDPEALFAFFGGPDGIATRMRGQLDRYTGTEGIMRNRLRTADDQIRRTTRRIATEEDRLLRREDQLRERFAGFQQTIGQLQNQQQRMFGMF